MHTFEPLQRTQRCRYLGVKIFFLLNRYADESDILKQLTVYLINMFSTCLSHFHPELAIIDFVVNYRSWTSIAFETANI